MECQLSMYPNARGWEIILTEDHSQVADSVHGQQQQYEAVATKAFTHQLLRLNGHQEL